MNKQCPKCKEFKTLSLAEIGLSIMGLSFIVLFIGFIILPFIIIGLILLMFSILTIIASLIMRFGKKKKMFFCQKCNYSWEE